MIARELAFTAGRFALAAARSGLVAAVSVGRRPVSYGLVLLVLLSASTWRNGEVYIDEVSSTLLGIRGLVAGDSEHYLAIADAFADGDFSMRYVEPGEGPDRAHRQPAYPVLLALAEHQGITRAPALAKINLAVVIAGFWLAFFGVAAATRSWLAASMAAATLYAARFLFDLATERLLTEPLYVAFAVGTAAAAAAYLARPRLHWLLLSSVGVAAAYLTRVNGLFLAGSLAAGFVASDYLRVRDAEPSLDRMHRIALLPLARYALAFALFVVATAPSWVPRVYYAGNPIYHGYLPNYLWVDDYESAHVPGPPQYTLASYAEGHGIADAASRLAFGVRRVFYETPRDKLGPGVSLALAASVAVLLALRSRVGLVLVGIGVLQLLPLVWTALPNPARRLPAAAMLPLVAVVVGVAAAEALKRGRRR